MSTKLSSCCVSGHLHSGNPEGKDGEVAGLPSYLTGSNDQKVLVFMPDIFGYALPVSLIRLPLLLFAEVAISQNVRLLADEYAKTGGFKVVVPDFFNGERATLRPSPCTRLTLDVIHQATMFQSGT